MVTISVKVIKRTDPIVWSLRPRERIETEKRVARTHEEKYGTYITM